jgi:alpha-amylase
MTRRCNAVGVRIYVDLLLNHMSATSGTGTAGSTANAQTFDYPAVPFTSADFHPPCNINWNDASSIRRCQLVGLPDLDQSRENVRARLVEMMNHLIDLGVAGFRADAMKHMEPSDLQNIFGRLKNLNTNYGFAANSRAFIVGEVIDHGGEAISGTEYFSIGTITEFRFEGGLARTFRGNSALRWLNNFGEGWGMHPSKYVLTFVDNHDSQRGGALTYKDGRLYKMATAFHLAWPYGIPRIMSSYEFIGHDEGPPQDSNGNIVSPRINADGSCANGWVCEHRWREIAGMVRFRNVVRGTTVSNWWDNADNQIAFSRGNRGFIAFNGQFGQNMNVQLQTGLSAGTYCDIISGSRVGNTCTGASFAVGSDGQATINIPSNHATGVIAIHAESRL